MNIEETNDKTPSGKFRSLAKKRMPRVLKLMKLIENLANPYHYEYDESQAKKIISDIKIAVSDVEDAFDKGLRKKKNNRNIDYEI